MRNEDKLGYFFLLTGVYVGLGLDYLNEGLFLQGIALGCFLKSAYNQIKEKNK
jgi:hypothetical protein